MITGGGNAAREAQLAREEQQRREDRIASGTRDIRTSFGDMFNGDYYANLRKDYKGYYGTQLDKQYSDSLKQLRSALLGRGIGSSSIGLGQERNLLDTKTLKEQDINEGALNASQSRHQDVINAQNQVIQQLQQSGDAGIAMSQAYEQQSALAQPPARPLLGSVFQDVTAGLATQADMERQGINRYNVFNRGGGGSRYMRNVGG